MEGCNSFVGVGQPGFDLGFVAMGRMTELERKVSVSAIVACLFRFTLHVLYCCTVCDVGVFVCLDPAHHSQRYRISCDIDLIPLLWS